MSTTKDPMDTLDDGLRILIVEDEERLRSLLEREIRAMGHTVDGVARAETAQTRLKTRCADVVFLDLNLPGMSGMELFDWIRCEKLPCRVVILTGHGALDSAIQAVRLQADDYLTKPCSLGDIDRVLARIHARKRSQSRESSERALSAMADLDTAAQWPASSPAAAPAAPERPAAPRNAAEPAAQPSETETNKSLEQLEYEHIVAVLRANGGNKPAAADVLGISLRTLYNKLRAYQLQGLLDGSQAEG